ITGIINSFTSKTEIGAPLAASYLLDMPDHYSSHDFKTIYWKGFLVPISPIMDYMYRPKEHEQYCLYDWIRLYSKSTRHHKASSAPVELTDYPTILDEGQGVADTAYHLFQSGHSQHSTHCVCLDNQRACIIPNFVGGPLPRRDVGDREYYCCTMLTLFKPWRSGIDLKDHTTTWDLAFDSHVFSVRQLQIMDNFNLKYECLDARDDHS
ncbi:hypothetical protein AURDEDRAFT_43058, partial [Auricularia subglabra TFB-10046 SS5]